MGDHLSRVGAKKERKKERKERKSLWPNTYLHEGALNRSITIRIFFLHQQKSFNETFYSVSILDPINELFKHTI